MRLTELKRLIKAEIKENGISYITWNTRLNGTDYLSSNFIHDCSGISDNQLSKLINAGLLLKDWDTLIVNKGV